MNFAPFLFAALIWPILLRADEWADLRAQYQMVTVAGGFGALSGDLNPNEWNNAEAQDALNAELSEPHFAMEDINGRIFVADKNAHAIRRIDPDGTIHTVAGMNLNEIPGGISNAGFNGDGPARQRLLDGPQIAYVMPDGSFYIGDSLNRRIRYVDLAGNMATIINDTDILSRGLWVRRDRQLIYYCTIEGTVSRLRRWTPAGGVVTVATNFGEAGNIDVDAAGNIYVSDRTLMGVYRVPPNYGGGAMTDALRVAGVGNQITTDSNAASNGQMATSVGMRGARGVAFHPLGGYFVATHRGGDVWYVDTAGRAWMFVQGDNGNTHLPGSAPVPTAGLVMSEPRSVSVGISGNVLIACNDSGYIRIVRNIAPKVVAPAWLPSSNTPAGAGLQWQSTPGKWYYLECSTDLGSSSWQPLAWLAGTGAATSFTDTGSTTASRSFYRLREFRGWPN